MEIQDLLMLLGGLALFLYGMQMMSNGLETAAGNKMKQILEKLTSNRVKGVLVGAGITAVIQSSSATTVMVVGFVNSGLMTLKQAVWVIMGANIGTTITGQLIALDIGAIAPLIAFVGVACIVFVKNAKIRHISEIFAGLGVLFIGMDMMGNAMVPLQSSESFINFMTTFKNPLMGILIGAVFTAIIQSSSASVGILQALAATGMIPLSSAVFILFGQNIGTCITAVLASIGTKVNAKRTTIIHLMFNIIGTAIFTIICLITPFVSLMESITPGNPVAQIANVHTVFNIITTLLLLPFGTLMANAAVKILPGSTKEEETSQKLVYIQPFESHYLIGHATLAISQLADEVSRMLSMVKTGICNAYDSLLTQNADLSKSVEENEHYIDYLNAEISKYIVTLMATEMSDRDSQSINSFYIITNNIERIGDHAMNIAGYTQNLKSYNLSFSDEARKEIEHMKNISLQTLDALLLTDVNEASSVLADTAKNEQHIDDMQQAYVKKQIIRMKSGTCKAETSLLFSELLTDFERIGDHALNIAEEFHRMT